LLGEAQSKCEHIAGVPLKPETARLLHQLYLAKGASATTAIEGNTLSEEEVLQHLQGRLEVPPSREYLKQEVENIIAGCNRILAEVDAGKKVVVDAQRVQDLNRTVLDKLALEKGVLAGEVRKHMVGVRRYRGAPVEDCPYLLNRLCDWLNGEQFVPPSGMEIVYSILKAVLAHLYLAWIHPFGDGNGRTARLLEFQILISTGVPAPAAHLLSNHYNQTRTEYYRQLDQASQSGGDALPFIMYAVQGFVDGLRAQLNVIRVQQWEVAWENYVHEAFRDRSGPSDVRRRHLVLDLSAQPQPLPILKLSQVSARIAAAYAKKTPKTLSRDVNDLLRRNLLRKESNGFRANKELILAFLPPRSRT